MADECSCCFNICADAPQYTPCCSRIMCSDCNKPDWECIDCKKTIDMIVLDEKGIITEIERIGRVIDYTNKIYADESDKTYLKSDLKALDMHLELLKDHLTRITGTNRTVVVPDGEYTPWPIRAELVKDHTRVELSDDDINFREKNKILYNGIYDADTERSYKYAYCLQVDGKTPYLSDEQIPHVRTLEDKGYQYLERNKNIDRLILDCGKDLKSIKTMTNIKKLLIRWLKPDSVIDIDDLNQGLEVFTYNSDIGIIKNLDMISNFVNLRHLSLIQCEPELTDITCLSSLVLMEKLYLQYNDITSIEPLRNMTKLNILDINNNPITDLSPLAACTQLTKLNIFSTEVSDIKCLSSCPLEYLDASVTNITEFCTFKDLKKLKISHCGLKDFSSFSECTKLEDLTSAGINSNPNVSGIEKLTNLKKLIIRNRITTDLELISNLTNIEYLEIDVLCIDLKFIRNYKKITELYVSLNKDEPDISDIKNLTNLKSLKLFDKISDLNSISSLVNLESVDVYTSDINFMKNYTKIKDLWLRVDDPIDVSILKTLNTLISVRYDVLNLDHHPNIIEHLPNGFLRDMSDMSCTCYIRPTI